MGAHIKFSIMREAGLGSETVTLSGIVDDKDYIKDALGGTVGEKCLETVDKQ